MNIFPKNRIFYSLEMNFYLFYIIHFTSNNVLKFIMKISYPQFQRIIWVSNIVIIHLIFSYYLLNGWWYSGIGTILIVLITYLFNKDKFLKEIGLKIKPVSIMISISLGVIAVIGSFIIMKYIAAKANIGIQYTQYGNYIHDVFYTLNEEIILGAVLLFGLSRLIKVHPFIISAMVAAVFSIIHFMFYKWIFLQKGLILPETLITLFLVGFFRNNLILKFRHIGFSWAFHFGWMAVMFGSYHFYYSSLIPLNEPERFNFYLGSLVMFVIAMILAMVSVIIFYDRCQVFKCLRIKNKD